MKPAAGNLSGNVQGLISRTVRKQSAGSDCPWEGGSGEKGEAGQVRPVRSERPQFHPGSAEKTSRKPFPVSGPGHTDAVNVVAPLFDRVSLKSTTFGSSPPKPRARLFTAANWAGTDHPEELSDRKSGFLAVAGAKRFSGGEEMETGHS